MALEDRAGPSKPGAGQDERQERIDLHRRHGRETVAALRRLNGSDTKPEDRAALHEIHARHERELGHNDNAAQAEARARRARNEQTP
jgi:hypothetical protein